jgi:FAD/FMN-containing dehydrogenase
MTAADHPTWTNWAGNIHATPRRIERPATIDDLRRAVAVAADLGQTIRVAGSGHSFSPICATDGLLLDLSLLEGIEEIDPDSGDVTMLAGTKLHAAGEPLLAAGRALANQGDIDRQAIAGALSTGTHGTGRKHGSFSAQARAVEVVSPEGDLVRIDASDAARFAAARLSIGLLGVVSRVTLSTVPAYKLREQTEAMSFDECLERYPRMEQKRRNAEFWWLPALDTCVVKSFQETTDDIVRPEIEEHPPGTLARYMRPEAVDWSYRIYPSQRTVPFVELEYTLPFSEGFAAIREARDVMQKQHPDCRWAVEYRTQPGEDAWLSPTQGADSVTISVHQAIDQPWEAFFRDMERVFVARGGRPHWGKLQYLDAKGIRAIYPAASRDAFERVRGEMDPAGVFANDYLRGLGLCE